MNSTRTSSTSWHDSPASNLIDCLFRHQFKYLSFSNVDVNTSVKSFKWEITHSNRFDRVCKKEAKIVFWTLELPSKQTKNRNITYI